MCKIKLSIACIMFLAGVLCQSCLENINEPAGQEIVVNSVQNILIDGPKITGEIEIVWKGGNGQNTNVSDKKAFAEFNAHQEYEGHPLKGEFYYRIFTEDMILKREIAASVQWVGIEGNTGSFNALVIYDSKGCEMGAGPGEHAEGCSGAEDHESGDDSHDEGCSTDHSEGSCSDEHSDGTDHTDGGCAGDDTDSGCNGSSGHDGNSNTIKGRDCRVGQLLYFRCVDGGTPAAGNDLVFWKWFDPDGNLPNPDHYTEWKLCEKEIIEGNLTVHNE